MKWKDTSIVYDWWMSEDGRRSFFLLVRWKNLICRVACFPFQPAARRGFSFFILFARRLNKKWYENCLFLLPKYFFLLSLAVKLSLCLRNEDIMWETRSDEVQCCQVSEHWMFGRHRELFIQEKVLEFPFGWVCLFLNEGNYWKLCIHNCAYWSSLASLFRSTFCNTCRLNVF